MVLEFNSQDIDQENDFAVSQKGMRASFFLRDSQFASVVEKLLDEGVKTELLQLPRDMLLCYYCFMANFTVTVYEYLAVL